RAASCPGCAGSEQIVAMRLDPAGAAVAATRRRRNFARGLEPLHPAHCARYAHFEMRGRLIARQPAQDHRLNHALAKIVGKTHPRRPHSRSVNEEAEINRFGNPPTDSIRSDTALARNDWHRILALINPPNTRETLLPFNSAKHQAAEHRFHRSVEDWLGHNRVQDRSSHDPEAWRRRF